MEERDMLQIETLHLYQAAHWPLVVHNPEKHHSYQVDQYKPLHLYQAAHRSLGVHNPEQYHRYQVVQYKPLHLYLHLTDPPVGLGKKKRACDTFEGMVLMCSLKDNVSSILIPRNFYWRILTPLLNVIGTLHLWKDRTVGKVHGTLQLWKDRTVGMEHGTLQLWKDRTIGTVPVPFSTLQRWKNRTIGTVPLL